MTPTPTPPVREMDVLLSQLLSHGLTLSDLSRDAPATMSYQEQSVSYERGSSPHDEENETFVVLGQADESSLGENTRINSDDNSGAEPRDGALPSVSVTIPLHVLASLLAQLAEDRDPAALVAYSVPEQEAPTLATTVTEASSSDTVPTPISIQPAGPIPPEARSMMSARTVEALEAMDLDTPPAEPGCAWYCVTQGTWIGLNNELSFVSFHVVGVPGNCHWKSDDWYQARESFLRSRNMGVCRLLSSD